MGKGSREGTISHLYASDTELSQGSAHLGGSCGVVFAVGNDFDEQRVIVGRYDSPLECRGIVQADAHALTTPENLLPEGSASQQLGWKLDGEAELKGTKQPSLTSQVSFYFCQRTQAPTLVSPMHSLLYCSKEGTGGNALLGSQITLRPVSLGAGGKGQDPTFTTCLTTLPPCRPILCPPSFQEQHAQQLTGEAAAEAEKSLPRWCWVRQKYTGHRTLARKGDGRLTEEGFGCLVFLVF